MALKNAAGVAEDLQELLRTNNKDVVTITWPDFYKVTGRDRIKDAFTKELGEKLKDHGLLLNCGQSVVLVAKDFKFSQVKIPAAAS